MMRRLGGGRIALDPCSNKSSHVKAEIELDVDLDGLNSDWSAVLKRNRKHGLVYINPPYDIAALTKVQAAQYKQYYLGVESISLVPAKTDQEWFHAALSSAVAIVFWQGRIGFWREGAPAQGSAFACCSVYYGADIGLLTEIVGELGTVLNLKALRDAARDAV
jgi:hypothetical protein